MKKRLVTVGLAMMTAIILLIAGCGEEKNYIEMSYYKHTPNCQSRKILSSLKVKTIAFTTRSSH